ncbi:CNDG2 protein, partial [Amia calva]|nr:CNDG2 protein [Amia calva]
MEKWSRGLDEDSGDEMEAEVPPALMETMSIIDGVTLVATASIAVVQEDVIYDGLLECAHVLNIVVGALPSSEAMVKISIQRFCESWWEKGLPGRENLGKTAFLMLLERNLLLRSSVADMKRLWNLHAVLLTFDFESEASEEVKDLLLQCFLSVQHIKREEGRRFLISLFSWNVNFIKMIHGTIKNQIQFFPKFIMEHVGEMYFRAWKKATGPFLEVAEQACCLQDYMHHGVHLHRSSPVHAKVRQILSYFHNQKLRQGVDEMLFRLYQPILWRALKARNSEVRANAALLFTEAFPIQDPSFNNEAMDSAIQKQFEVLFSLLEDPQPLVRSTGILGVCRITSKYWEMIPPAILTDFLKKMVIDLAADVSCADVRCAVFKCMTLVVDNKLSHPLLEQLLPLLKNSLHDNSEKVRVAVVELLLKIKAVRAAKFWKVCTMEHLLARLETDSHSVARRLVNLLFNSFFPVNQSEEVWCERCVALIQMNPTAARRFYQYAHEHTAPTNIAKLMLMIRRCLNACIQQAGKEEQDETESSNKENSSILDDVLSITDTATMASLLEVIVILWRSIRRSLELNEEALQYTTSKFASILPEYFRVFKEERCTVPLMLIASFMPAAAVPTFRRVSCGVLSKLRNLEKGAVESQYGTLIDCLCRWGQAGHVVEVVTDWLTDALPQKKTRSDCSFSHSGVSVCVAVGEECSNSSFILPHNMAQRWNLKRIMWYFPDHFLCFFMFIFSLQVVFYAYISSSEMGPCQIDKETAMRAYSLHGRLSIHLQHKYLDDRSYLQVLEKSAAWVAEKILPFLVVPSEDTVSDQQLTTTKQVVEDRLTVLRDVVMVGLADADFKGQALHFCIAVLHAEKGYMCVPSLLSLLKEVAEDCLAQSARSQSEELSVLLSVVANVFQKILEAAARRLQKQREEGLQVRIALKMCYYNDDD